MRPPATLAISALPLSGHRRRQIACHSGTSLGVGRGENHLAPNQGCTKGGPFVPIITHLRWTPTSHLIVHFLSSFIEHPNPFPNRAVTHRIVTIHLTDLVINLAW